MALVLYNTLSRQEEEFRPLQEGMVRLYTCGPTVYDYAHIGNFRTFVFEDLLRRYLLYRGYRVVQVMNITDVDDKTIRGARAAGESLEAYTARYTEAFFEDLDTLRIARAEHYPRATAHISQMVALVEALLDRGYAYRSEGSIYFAIDRLPGYGRLARVKPTGLREGVRVDLDEYEKENPRDFALWKAPREGEPAWETPLGRGRPGWHIECSAMSMAYLGGSFDIHTGGVDNIFPHHENEIAQSEAAMGKPFVRYWLHCEHLIVGGQKMSKSLGNYHTLRDLLARGHDPLAIRYFLLSGHYRGLLNLTEEGLGHAAQALERLRDFARRAREGEVGEGGAREGLELVAAARRGFEAGMDADLNAPRALAAVFEGVRQINSLCDRRLLSGEERDSILQWLKEIDSCLGVLEGEAGEELEASLAALVAERERARKQGDYERADRLREELWTRGIALEDTPRGVRWKRRSKG